MEDVVAVRIELADGDHRYVLTWGRIFDTVDSSYLESVVLRECRRFALGGEPVAAVVCPTLREAAESPRAPYFFEHYLWFASNPIRFGPEYQSWREERAAALESGRELLYCGRSFRAS